MNHKELTEILNTDSKFESLSIHKWGEENGKFFCTLKEVTSLSKNGFYLYSCREVDTKELALEGAVLHLLRTGTMPNISIVSEKKVKEPKPKKPKKEEVIDEPGESTI